MRKQCKTANRIERRIMSSIKWLVCNSNSNNKATSQFPGTMATNNGQPDNNDYDDDSYPNRQRSQSYTMSSYFWWLETKLAFIWKTPQHSMIKTKRTSSHISVRPSVATTCSTEWHKACSVLTPPSFIFLMLKWPNVVIIKFRS